MKFLCHAFLIFTVWGVHIAMGQDKIYIRNGGILEGKVHEVSKKLVKYTKATFAEGPAYVIDCRDIDSIVYSNGAADVLKKVRAMLGVDQRINIPYKNTFATDQMSYLYYSLNYWYERRVWNDRIGIRVPFHITYGANGAPGYGISFLQRVILVNSGGFGFSTGINPKFYFNRHRHVRAFAGPELTIGYSRLYAMNYNSRYYSNYKTSRDVNAGNFASLIVAGVCFNIRDKGHITLEGGYGYNILWGDFKNYDTPVWKIGVSFGGNF